MKEQILKDLKMRWNDFVESVHSLITPSLNDPPLNQYLDLRDHVRGIVKDEKFLTMLEEKFKNYLEDGKISNEAEDPFRAKITEALLLELKGFKLAVEVNQTIDKSADKQKAWSERWLGKASIVIGSFKDFCDDIPLLKNGLTVYQELVDLFKGEALVKKNKKK